MILLLILMVEDHPNKFVLFSASSIAGLVVLSMK